jgi:hypothetical protein
MFRDTYPDFEAVEAQIRRARLERSLAIAQMIATGIDALFRGAKALKASLEANFRRVELKLSHR